MDRLVEECLAERVGLRPTHELAVEAELLGTRLPAQRLVGLDETLHLRPVRVHPSAQRLVARRELLALAAVAQLPRLTEPWEATRARTHVPTTGNNSL